MLIASRTGGNKPSTESTGVARRGPKFPGTIVTACVLLLVQVGGLLAIPPSREDSVRERIRQAVRDGLAATQEGAPHAGEGVLVYVVPSPSDITEMIRCELRYGRPQGGYRLRTIREDEAVTEYGREHAIMELRLMAPGREEFSREFRFRPGEVIVWDDIVLAPLTARKAGKIEGSIWLEEDPPLEGMTVCTARGEEVRADENGRFIFHRVGPGTLKVYAWKHGYSGLHAEVTVEIGRVANAELDGYLERSAVVHWAYITDESKEFKEPNLNEETAIISPKGLDRVSFAAGFEQVHSKSDFLVGQEKDSLSIRNFDASGPGGPGIIKISGMKFEEVDVVPKVDFSMKTYPLKRGDLFLFRCFDGKHFAKLEVLDVFTGDVPAEAMRRLIKGR